MADGESGAEEDGKKPPAHHKIGNAEVAPILLMAGLFDLVSLVPVPIGAIFGQIVMTVIWLLHNIKPWGKKYWVWYLVTWVMEFIPFVSALPVFMFGASRMIAISRVNEELQEHGIDSEKAKQLVRIGKGRLFKEGIKAAQQKAIWESGAQRDKQGNVTGYDKGKRAEKSRRIEDRGAKLDAALERKSPRQPGGGTNKSQPVNNKPQNVDGVAPADEEAA